MSAHPAHLVSPDFFIASLLFESYPKPASNSALPGLPLRRPGPASQGQILTWIHPWLEGLHQGLDWIALPFTDKTPACCRIRSHCHPASAIVTSVKTPSHLPWCSSLKPGRHLLTLGSVHQDRQIIKKKNAKLFGGGS